MLIDSDDPEREITRAVQSCRIELGVTRDNSVTEKRWDLNNEFLIVRVTAP